MISDSSEKWLDTYFKKWSINQDGTIDVFKYNKYISTNIPNDIQFNIAHDNFFFHGKNVTSLRGSPKICKLRFNCTNTYITSLEFASDHIDGYFNCSTTLITSLEHCPKYVGGDFWCRNTNIKKAYDYRHALWCEIGGKFNCGIPEINDIINNCKNDQAKRPLALAALRKIQLW